MGRASGSAGHASRPAYASIAFALGIAALVTLMLDEILRNLHILGGTGLAVGAVAIFAAASGVILFPAHVGLSAARLLVLAILALYALGALILGPSKVGFPGGPEPFVDLTDMTNAWQCAREGVNMFVANSCDPGQRFDSPPIWLWLRFLGLGPGDTNVLGVLIATVFIAAALSVLPRGARAIDAVAYGVVLCSPAAMLGIAHGNVDIVVFSVLVAALLLFRGRGLGGVLGHGLLLLAAMLKLFPIFAAGVLLRQQRRRALLGFGGVALAFIAYALAIRSDIHVIQHRVGQLNDISFGIFIFVDWLARGASGALGNHSYRDWANGITVLIVVMAVVAFGRRRAQLSSPATEDGRRRLDLFVAGAGVYIATYYYIRNFDYRLAFLLLAVPQLLDWTRARSKLAIVTLGALVGTVWLDYLLTQTVPGLGRVTRWWNSFATFAPFDRPLTLAVAMQVILFAGLISCLVAVSQSAVRDAGRRAAGWASVAPGKLGWTRR